MDLGHMGAKLIRAIIGESRVGWHVLKEARRRAWKRGNTQRGGTSFSNRRAGSSLPSTAIPHHEAQEGRREPALPVLGSESMVVRYSDRAEVGFRFTLATARRGLPVPPRRN